MNPRVKTAAVVVAVLLARSTAAADPAPGPQHIETDKPRLMCIPPAPTSSCIELQPGHFVDSNTWSKLDLALKAAQDKVTNLDAQNASLRASAASWQPGWKTLGAAVLAGISLGWYAHSKL